jgi:uncharacterized glyoxalase superfamily protein PhnB
MSSDAPRRQPETLRLRSVSPGLTVNDIQKSIAWYRDIVGFIVAEEWQHEGKLSGAVLRAGTMEILLGQDDFAKGRDRQKGLGMRIYCKTEQDIDQLAATIISRGGTLEHGPKDQSWGVRDLALIDPDGFRMSIYKDR